MLAVEHARRAASSPARRVRVRVDADLRAAHDPQRDRRDRPRGRRARRTWPAAHLDSVVAGPGLNDNGSGVAAVLEVAEQLAAPPARRTAPPLRVGFWGAEEIGLVGSRRYVRRLSRAERRRIRAYVNLDMVGSPGEKAAVYAGARRGGPRDRGRAARRAARRTRPRRTSAAPPTTRRSRASTSRSAGSSPGWTAATTGPATGSATSTRRSPRRTRGPRRMRSWRWPRARRELRLGREVGRRAPRYASGDSRLARAITARVGAGAAGGSLTSLPSRS